MKTVLMKQDHSNKKFKVGDVCTPSRILVEQFPNADGWCTLILIKRVQSFQSGIFWEVLRADSTRSVIKEDLLEKVSLTSVK
jgi:hypothetical protein